MNATYKFYYHDQSVYKNVVDLLKEFGEHDGVHLDIGCGYGAIAEPVRELGLTYLGFDADAEALQNLHERGFEAKQVDLQRPEDAFAVVEAAVAGRKVASITIIDTLEHVTNGLALLDRLREFAAQRSILLAISVPNAGHRDLGAKLVTGHWDYTRSGLLDHTHVIHHTDRLITAMMEHTGWRQVAVRDFCLEDSDQAFPKAHPLLGGKTFASQYLRQIRSASDPFGEVNQLVRAYLPGARTDAPLLSDPAEARPFLSIVTRTQGKRLGNLRDVLLCFTAQTSQDFEVIVVGHKLEEAAFFAVRRIVDDLPASVRERVRFVRCDRGGRATPLNDGFALARGHYITICDDDELVFAHWVETFKMLSLRSPGCVLRSVCAEQDIVSTGTRADGALGYRTVSAITTPYPSTFDFFAHLSQNYSPTCAYAFPRAAFQDLGIQFDESLDTAEDWDFEMRTIFVCGVESCPDITGIYRKWQSGESSFAVHSEDHWRRDYDKIVAKHNDQYHVFPPGTINFIVEQRKWIQKLEHDIASLQGHAKLDIVRRFLIRHPRLNRVARVAYRNAKTVARRIVRRLG